MPPVVGRLVWQCALSKRFPRPNGTVSALSFTLGSLVLFLAIMGIAFGSGGDDGPAVGGAMMFVMAVVLFIPVYMTGCVSPSQEKADDAAERGDGPGEGQTLK